MSNNPVMEAKINNIVKALHRDPSAYVPVYLSSTYSTCAWAGITAVEAMKDDDLFVRSMTKFFDDVWVDAISKIGGWFTPELPEVFDPIQHKFSPDGTTPENVQIVHMNEDEYEQMIADPIAFTSEVMLPRKYPRLFSDREWAKDALKAYAAARQRVNRQQAKLMSALDAKYGVTSMLNPKESVINPFDILFDNFRGFKGTLTDLRRHPDKVSRAIDKLWECKCLSKFNSECIHSDLLAMQVPHIPEYLSTKQFEELYWPYEKQMLQRLADADNKIYILLEGKWLRYLKYFLQDLPDDLCVFAVDDDDFYEVYDVVKDRQLLCGGIRATSLRLDNIETIKDEAKRIIDTCARDRGFIFGVDKSCISPGDINRNLADLYNFVHEYGSQR